MKKSQQIAAETYDSLFPDEIGMDRDLRKLRIIHSAIWEGYMDGYAEGAKDMTEAAKEVTRPL